MPAPRELREQGERSLIAADARFPYDREALLREREIRPRSLVAGRDVHDQEVEHLSEP